MRAWLDANVVLRLFTQDPPSLGARARALMARAGKGELDLRLTPLTVAEVVWTLASYYGYDRARIAEVVGGFLDATGIGAEEGDVIRESLIAMSSANVSFVDGYVAARARALSEPVCTFDRDFERLGVRIIDH